MIFVLLMAVLLVFLVLLIEFRSLIGPIAIVWGSLLSLFGVALALIITGTSLNIISFLGAIIGIGIVAKNGILMLDRVEFLRGEGLALEDALVHSGRRRLRPVLMTSLAAALGMLPLAYGVGSGDANAETFSHCRDGGTGNICAAVARRDSHSLLCSP